ncbi:MAG: BrnT family toxin [Terriglobales bacterium]
MTALRFEWDENKNRKNLLRHDVRFEIAVLVFDDPHALTQTDQFSEDEERWVTLGAIDTGVVLFVVHTWRERSGEGVIRIISARTATPRERRRYEEAQQRTKARHRRHRGQERGEH